jgi:hypothetical protein
MCCILLMVPIRHYLRLWVCEVHALVLDDLTSLARISSHTESDFLPDGGYLRSRHLSMRPWMSGLGRVLPLTGASRTPAISIEESLTVHLPSVSSSDPTGQ